MGYRYPNERSHRRSSLSAPAPLHNPAPPGWYQFEKNPLLQGRKFRPVTDNIEEFSSQGEFDRQRQHSDDARFGFRRRLVAEKCCEKCGVDVFKNWAAADQG